MANYEKLNEEVKEVMAYRKVTSKIARRQIRHTLKKRRQYEPGNIGCQYDKHNERDQILRTTTRRQRRKGLLNV